jgi:hypothetical protein
MKKEAPQNARGLKIKTSDEKIGTPKRKGLENKDLQ